MRYLIYCDESDDKGSFYSNFYGGALLREADRQKIEQRLLAAKGDKASSEYKWTEIGPHNEERYIRFIEEIFALVEEGLLKFRVMFTQNINQTRDLGHDLENEYFILYYYFLKHAFGLQHCNVDFPEQTVVSVFLDDVPDTKEKFDNFKGFLSGLTTYPLFFNARVAIPKPGITAVDSKQHVILQAVDVVLGAIQFRLNEKHKIIPKGARRRGKRTRAKERVYKRVIRLIQDGYPHFNIGVSTGEPEPEDRWRNKYAHWIFQPRGSVKDHTRGKRHRKKKK
jgi:Protein of unknown function (DUF3800)